MPLILFLVLIGILVFILGPILIGYPISLLKSKTKRILGYIILILFYPIVGSILSTLFFIIMILYPFLREKYHHGVYDPIDNLVSKFAIWYMKFIVMVISSTKLCFCG